MTRYIFEVIVDTDQPVENVQYQLVRALEDRGQLMDDARIYKTQERQEIRDGWAKWRDMLWDATVCRIEKSNPPISRVMLVRGTSSSRITGGQVLES